MRFCSVGICLAFGPILLAQNQIGLQTSNPDAPVHIYSSGQVNYPGGLLLLGDRSEGHMEMDFDLLQSRYGATNYLPLRLQPLGGKVGINTPLPDAPLHLYSSGQVNTVGGLFLLGDRSEGHMEIDFDRLQSLYGVASYLPLRIQPVGGDLNVGQGLIFADRANRFVGINTDAPNTELQVHGEMRMTTAGLSATQKDKIAIHNQLEDPSALAIGWLKTAGDITGLNENDPARNALIDVYGMYYRSEGAHRWFVDQVADENTPKMILTPEGDLGVGVASPLSKLHVTNGYTADFSGKGYLQLGNTNSLNLVMDNNDILVRIDGGPSTMYLQRFGGNISMTDAASGRVGIGTTSPAAKLHVADGGEAGLGTHGYMVLGQIDGLNMVFDRDDIQVRHTGTPYELYLQRFGGNLFLCKEQEGKVFIGTGYHSLPDGYLLAVDGGIMAEEVRVRLSEDWPDYVFEPSYELKPLDRLSEEINILGHLPGVPSATDVARDGIDLGEMQRILTEKIEELTLYVVRLHEQNQRLEEEITALKGQNK